jgi:hypothetical protein
MDKMCTIRPKVINDVLVNPGVGFQTFQRFNGDLLNDYSNSFSWTEGHPIEYQPARGTLTNPGYPDTSMSYFRIYWRYMEPERGVYRWDLIDRALETSRQRGQMMFLRIAPYGSEPGTDVPDWYRAMVGEGAEIRHDSWVCDPEDPRYAECFGGFISALGCRYNGHPDLEAVDTAIVGFWGEGAGSDWLSQDTREALMDAYLNHFPDTLLVSLLTDPATNGYGLARRPKGFGWRIDCLGDVGGFSKEFCHMYDYYPQRIIESGMADAWKTGPVSIEVCWVMMHWYKENWDVDYIIEQSLKWHISSFNAKSSPVPDAWKATVDGWLRCMGYRLAPRKVTFNSTAQPGGELDYTSWWENLGVAPCYRRYPLAFRLTNDRHQWVLKTTHDMRTLLPGDSFVNGTVVLPHDLPRGNYALEWAMLGTHDDKPAVQFAVEGRQADGWYGLGNIQIMPD